MFTTSPGESSAIPVQIAGGPSSALAVIATNAVETITKTIRTAANLALHRGELTLALLVPSVTLDSSLFARRHFPPSLIARRTLSRIRQLRQGAEGRHNTGV